MLGTAGEEAGGRKGGFGVMSFSLSKERPEIKHTNQRNTKYRESKYSPNSLTYRCVYIHNAGRTRQGGQFGRPSRAP